MPELDEGGNIMGFISIRRSPTTRSMTSEDCAVALQNFSINPEADDAIVDNNNDEADMMDGLL